ncbi:DUF547 domain-containing protein [Rubinisphaera italica]|uniref:DUF547 domain-containing protein n=1 Tax=Rubinisphaera italica TaxID=2527969 RepID=A0A5C5XM53_9PLAN|nr:DUF547 domain-containing protein [Rubinisphaera italica]TWT64040.1 hypothetical protein Pan54_48000 [Rubinisphaera italica]
MKRSAIGVITIGIALAGWWATTTLAGPTITVGRNVPANQQVPVDKIDHSIWNSLLSKYVDNNGYVDYSTWKASSADQQLLDTYIQQLSAASFSTNSTREAKLAFWINAYNAVSVKGILREYPTTSIRNHTAKVYGYNIWKDLQLLVGSQPYSLEAIEHEVLRKMGEPRIHFAIVCASIGCPRLYNEAYTASKLDEQLTLNTQAFFADPTKFTADTASGTIQVSPIMKWFAEDFGSNTAAQMKTIAPYVPDQAQALTASGQARVNYLDYDWGLNDQAKVRGSSRR